MGFNQALDIRLGCSCLFHYHCLVRFIKMELGDKEALIRNSDGGGIICPNYVAGVCSYCHSFDAEEKGGKYYLNPKDLQYLKEHRERKLMSAEMCEQFTSAMGEDEMPLLTDDEISKLKIWLSEAGSRCSMGEVERGEWASESGVAVETCEEMATSDSLLALIIATSKKCPNSSCGNRETHFHGHGKTLNPLSPFSFLLSPLSSLLTAYYSFAIHYLLMTRCIRIYRMPPCDARVFELQDTILLQVPLHSG